MRDVSIATMLEQMEGLLDTNELTLFQEQFIKGMKDQLSRKVDFTLKQVDYLEQLYYNYFA